MSNLPNNTTFAALNFDQDVYNTLDHTGDRDWMRIDVPAGQFVQVTQRGTGDNPLFDPLVRVYNSEGLLITADDELNASGGDFDAAAIFGGGAAQTYYVEAGAYRDQFDGDYTLNATVVQSPTGNLVDVLGGGTRRTDTEISVYFVPAGERAAFGRTTNTTQDDVISEGWSNFERGQVEAALETISAVTNLNFTTTTNPNADYQLVVDTNEFSSDGFLGYFYLPEGTRASVGIFNGSGYGWDNESGDGLKVGGLGFATLVHEFMHGLGLEHPHDSDSPLTGVHASTGDYGVNGLNQGIYSTMSYNGGYASVPTVSHVTGNEAGPMALDVAALQQLYGANNQTALGDDTYVIAATGRIAWQTIWDAGGNDTIQYDGSRNTTIDLRAATLTYEIGGGGFVSFAEERAGGFTIANGVVIENALGGSGDDRLVANAAGNGLNGNEGDDVLVGGAGNDTLIGGADNDTITGAFGNDAIFGGTGDDIATGGAGNDEMTGDTGNDDLSGNSGADEISVTDGVNILNGNSGRDLINGGADVDTINGGSGNDVLNGNGGNDILEGGRGADTIDGGAGNDTMNGGMGADVLTGGAGEDTFIFSYLSDSAAGARDEITDFETGQDIIDLSQIDADRAANSDQAFSFIGTDEFDFAGQVRLDVTATNTIVQVDRDGDGYADLEIMLTGTTTVEAFDFVL